MRTEEVARTAVVSDDGVYRYELRRRWGDRREHVAFIMLNPSTADAEVDDPTIRRCMGFARRLDYDALCVVNIYAYRATDPGELTTASWRGVDVVGPENERYVLAQLESAALVIAAWGAHRNATALGLEWYRRCCTAPWRCLSVTKGGSPGHPLYLAANAELVRWPA